MQVVLDCVDGRLHCNLYLEQVTKYGVPSTVIVHSMLQGDLQYHVKSAYRLLLMFAGMLLTSSVGGVVSTQEILNDFGNSYWK